jgi:hypothetical protein
MCGPELQTIKDVCGVDDCGSSLLTLLDQEAHQVSPTQHIQVHGHLIQQQHLQPDHRKSASHTMGKAVRHMPHSAMRLITHKPRKAVTNKQQNVWYCISHLTARRSINSKQRAEAAEDVDTH